MSDAPCPPPLTPRNAIVALARFPYAQVAASSTDRGATGGGKQEGGGGAGGGRAHVIVKVEHTAATKQRQASFLVQNEQASSMANSTPPMGAPKAALMPAEAPADTNSR